MNWTRVCVTYVCVNERVFAFVLRVYTVWAATEAHLFSRLPCWYIFGGSHSSGGEENKRNLHEKTKLESSVAENCRVALLNGHGSEHEAIRIDIVNLVNDCLATAGEHLLLFTYCLCTQSWSCVKNIVECYVQ